MTIAKIETQPGPNQATDRDAWLEFRKTGIGASEAPAACGISPYRQPLDIYLEKRGEIEPQEENNDHSRN